MNCRRAGTRKCGDEAGSGRRAEGGGREMMDEGGQMGDAVPTGRDFQFISRCCPGGVPGLRFEIVDSGKGS